MTARTVVGPTSPRVGNDAPAPVYDLITVDVWDTLLRRRCHPDSVKLHLCRYLRLNYASLLPVDRRDDRILLRLRQQAERELGAREQARGGDDEYRHQEVYARWLEFAGLSPLLQGETVHAALLATLENLELAQEKYVSYVDPDIVATLAALPARRRLFLSDFYLPASDIRELLLHHGIGDLLEDGVVSCEVGVNKRSGRLFRHLHERFAVAPQRHLHLGDNPHADVSAARGAGVSAMHYQPEPEHARRQRREAAFHAPAADALRAALSNSLTEPAPAAGGPDAIRRHGHACAPLFIGFVQHVMESAVADRVEQLYFFTREGEFFLEIYRRLATSDVLGFAPPPATLLEVSRVATFAGSLREFSAAELMRLWNQYSVQSLHALFKSLGMDPEPFTASAARHGLDMAELILYPWQDSRVLAFLDDVRVREETERALEARRTMLHAYLAGAGLSRTLPRTVGIVDIGWRGTIQDNLAYALPESTLHGYYLGLNTYLNAQPENTRKSAFGPDLNRSDDYRPLLDFVAPLEMLCNSPHGSVDGYRADTNGAQAHRLVDADENRIHEEYVRHFQAGVLDAVPFWADFLRVHAYSAEEMRPLALELWSGLIRKPPPYLASAYFRLKHNENFGVGGFSDKRRSLATVDIAKALFLKPYRARLQGFLSEIGWVPGLLACPDRGRVFRTMLRAALYGMAVKSRFRGWIR